MAICPTVTLYIASIFPQETLKWLVRIIVVYSIVQTGIFLLPGKIWSSYFYTLYGLAFLALLSTSYTTIMAVINRRDESVILLLGWIGSGVTTVFSVLNIAQFISAGETFQYGFLFFVAAQAYLLSKRFSRAFNQVETLSSELSVSNQRLQRLDELKNQFLANTSHELRTPLNGIIGLTEALRAGSKGPVSAAVDRSLAMIAASGRRLSMLVNDILDAEKLRNHDIELSRHAVDLHEIAGSVLQLSQSLADTKSLELRNDVPTDLPPVDADENRLQQILQNLIGNAIKFTPSGSVTVSAAEHDDDGIEIRVSDTGIGIPADKFDTIFRSFEQGDASTEREFGGTGLGLSITKKLVELHGGTIAVDSEPGRGSCFTFTLKKAAADAERSGIPSLKPEQEPAWPQPIVLPDKPAEVQDAGAARPAIAEGNGNGNGHRPTVLVVDDDEVNRNVVADFLGLRSYDVLEAEDGEKALALMRENQPDIVLLDIMMPKMNGYEVCRQIRSEYDEADMPIIFLSAKDHMEDVVAGFESGGNDYLPKPVAGPELLARVATHLKLLNIQDTMVKEEKLAAIGQVASGIVHDFKNSINIIRGYAEMIAAEEDEPGSEAAAFAATISAEADRIAAMTHEIVDYARGGIWLELEEIAIGDFLERVRAAIRPAFDLKHCRFEIVDEAHGTLRIDSARMIGAFATIAGNACDVMSADGTFTIRARRDGKTVTFELADDGPGIPEDIRDRLFDPFGTFGKDRGTGLGMALVQSIVDAHGGTIRFETEIGKGTTFFIEIPEAEEGAPRA
jgi:two-component system sensor histidine kinase ChiS